MMVYLIHFDQPYHHARHYVGWTAQSPRAKSHFRLSHHFAGTGSRLMAAVSKAGIGWRVVRVWHGADRTFERAIHRQNNTRRLCPVCNGRKGRLRSDKWRRGGQAA